MVVLGKLFGFLLVLLVLAGAAAGGAWFYAQNLYTKAGPATADGKPRIVTVKKGATPQSIAANLKGAGAIEDEFQFRLAVRVHDFFPGEDGVLNLRAGEFTIPSKASIKDISKVLSSGAPLQYTVVVPEGLTSAMVMRQLTGKAWKAAGGIDASMKLAGDPPTTPAEGVLLPGDYMVARGDTVESVVQRAIKRQQDLIAKAWSGRQGGLPFKTPDEAINLASIVEKETGNADERPEVAAVFVNRMKRGMRLESDPTIIYGITKGEPLGRIIRTAERARKTDWNTYEIDGLPKTPICNPGAEAITAVLNPPASKSLYFVGDGKGGHVFADTYAEHQKNVATYWKVRAANEKAGVNTPAVRQQ